MIQKIILISILFFNISLNAATITIDNPTYRVNEDVTINFSDMRGQNKDWIGIYPVGSNNAWKNVIQWYWTNDLVEGKIRIKGLPIGNYEVRAFYNNSFDTEAVQEFSVISDSGIEPPGRIYTEYINGNLKIIVSPTIWGQHMDINSDDWVGIYKKNPFNEWENVEWAYIRSFLYDDFGNLYRTYYNINLEPGKYEVRYFLKNSYIVHKSKGFTVHHDDNYNLSKIEINNFEEDFKVFLHPIDEDHAIAPEGSKDWIGLYRKEKSNEWKNVIRWAWVDDMELEPHHILSTNFGILKLPLGEYEVRYFRNNSYITYKSERIIIHK